MRSRTQLPVDAKPEVRVKGPYDNCGSVGNGDELEVVLFPGSRVWDGEKGELWEVRPRREKMVSYQDQRAMQHRIGLKRVRLGRLPHGVEGQEAGNHKTNQSRDETGGRGLLPEGCPVLSHGVNECRDESNGVGGHRGNLVKAEQEQHRPY